MYTCFCLTYNLMPMLIFSAFNGTFYDNIYWWYDIFNKTLDTFGNNVHILSYDRLKTNTFDELLRLISFLGVPVTRDDITCAVRLGGGKHRRITEKSERERLVRLLYDDRRKSVIRKAIYIAEQLLKFKTSLTIDLRWNID